VSERETARERGAEVAIDPAPEGNPDPLPIRQRRPHDHTIDNTIPSGLV